MGLRQLLAFRPAEARADAAVPLSGINNPNLPLYASLAGYLDGLVSGAPPLAGLPGVSVDTANRLTAVYRCVSIIAGTVSALPLNVFDRDPKTSGRSQVFDPNDRYLWGRPNPEVSKQVFWETEIAHIALAGNAYLYPARAGSGAVGELWPIHPNRVQVGRDPQTKLKVYTIDGDRDTPYRDVMQGGEIIHIPGIGTNGLTGYSPIGAARLALQLSLAAEQYGARLFTQGSRPGGFLSTDQILEEDVAEKLMRRWEKFHRGLEQSHKVAVMDAGMKWQDTTIPPDDAQFLQTREFQVEEISRLFGVPLHLLGAMTKATSWGTGLEEQARSFITFTLRGYSGRIEAEISDQLLMPANRYAKFNYRDLMRGNTLQRYQAYQLARVGGWMSINDIREEEDMPPIPDGGDSYLQPLNSSPVAMSADKDPAPDAAVTTGPSNPPPQ